MKQLINEIKANCNITILKLKLTVTMKLKLNCNYKHVCEPNFDLIKYNDKTMDMYK